MAQPGNINEMIAQLIKTKNLEDTDILTFLNNQNKSELWEYVIAFLEDEGSKIGHYPIWEQDFSAAGTSLFEYINNNIDLDNSENYDFNSIINKLKSQTNDDGTINKSSSQEYPWNDSLAAAITHYIRYFANFKDFEGNIEYNTDKTQVTDTNGSIPTTGTLNSRGGFRVDSIMNGNAGKSFTAKPWVEPNYNIDAETYDAVRGIDEILEALTSNTEMQYTHTQNSAAAQLNKYIRLLMPKYLRRVEVEDLDRNFWVIGQVLAAISSYLFDPKSPITEEFKKLLNEITQLWENVLYLWVLYAILSQGETKPLIEDIHGEFVYLPEDEWKSFLKYDNFDTTAAKDVSLNTAKKKFDYLKQAYSDSHLVVVPIVRSENYYKNFYTTEKIPCYFIYNRNTDTWSEISLKSETDGYVFFVSPDTYKNSIGAIRETSEGVYDFFYPYGSIVETYEKEPSRYYGLVRLVPTNLEYSYSNNTIKVTNISADFYDVSTICSNACNNKPRLIESWTYHGEDATSKWSSSAESLSRLNNEKDVHPNKGFYMGEIATDYEVTQKKIYNGELVTVSSVPIRQDSTQTQINVQGESYLIPNYNDWPQVDQVINQIKTNGIDNSILRASVDKDKQQGSSSFKNNLFKIYVTNRIVGVQEKIKKDPYEYKYIENSNLVDKNTGIGVTFGNSIDTGAILYDSEADRIINYSNYSFNHVPGYGAYVYPSGHAYGWSSNVAQIWTQGNTIETNNWCVKFVQATGVYTTKDSGGNIKYYDTNHQEQILNSSQFTNNNQWNNYNNSIVICSCVQVTLFFPDGSTQTKIYDRWGLNSSNEDGLFFRIGSDWATSNGFTLEEQFNGQYWLVKKSSNYDNLDPYPNGWHLFNEDYLRNYAQAGISANNTRILGLGNYWDFSHNPNNGYVASRFIKG